MRLLTIILIFALVSGILATASFDENQSAVPHQRVRRWSIGCPFKQRVCHRHCRRNGRRTGHCGGTLKLVCICVRR
uniref:Putative tick defensin n=1 Tax=Rhipicephalus pulchellus TaxID=72859 RepID=L7LTH3_RHIPC